MPDVRAEVTVKVWVNDAEYLRECARVLYEAGKSYGGDVLNEIACELDSVSAPAPVDSQAARR